MFVNFFFFFYNFTFKKHLNMNTFIVHLSSKSINIHINKVIVIFAITPAGLEKKKEKKFM